MKEYILSYYNQFNCIASECKHTCCAGWEMCIDKDSLTAYKADKSEFSCTLKQGINFRKSKFRRDKLKRCAFLNQNGLCEIITNLGEKSLCQVCRDHPRFRSFFNDRIETGLGFCCEEATRIILSYKDKIKPVLTKEDNSTQELDINQKFILEFRDKAIAVLQDRTKDINQRINSLLLLCKADLDSKEDKRIIKNFLSLERIDKGWTKRLKSIKNQPLIKNTDNAFSLYCEQFIVNSLYRHLHNADDTMWVRAITIALVVSWWLIITILSKGKEKEKQDFELVVEIVRAFSQEIEYSQKNLDKLFRRCYRYVKV